MNKVPTKTKGCTCIGCGLNQAVDILKRAGKAEGGVIILVTDGMENEKPYINAVFANVKATGVRIVSIAFGCVEHILILQITFLINFSCKF
jgi:Mg-chelatase subunit ChlD